MRMIDAVAGAVKRDPNILGAAVGLAEAVDDGLGNAAVGGERFGIAAEADDFAGRARAIFEDETRNEKMLSADAQVRLAGDQHLALGLSGQRDRLGGGAGAGEDDLEIAPLAFGEDNRVARLRLFDRRLILRLIGHEQVARPRGMRRRCQHHYR